MQTHTTNRRRTRVYKSLHKPITYLGVERTLQTHNTSVFDDFYLEPS